MCTAGELQSLQASQAELGQRVAAQLEEAADAASLQDSRVVDRMAQVEMGLTEKLEREMNRSAARAEAATSVAEATREQVSSAVSTASERIDAQMQRALESVRTPGCHLVL